MSNRVMNRRHARELTVEEVERISGAGTISSHFTFTGPGPLMLPGDDIRVGTCAPPGVFLLILISSNLPTPRSQSRETSGSFACSGIVCAA